MSRGFRAVLPAIPALVLTTALAAAAAGAPSAAGPAGPTAPSGQLVGFSAARAVEERALEARFDAGLDPKEIRGWLERLSARPHHLGSAYGKDNAEYLAGLFRGWGFDTRIEEFSVLFPTPLERRLELVAPSPFTASLAEPPLPEDATSGQTGEQLPPYNAYSIDGDVTGDLVYVNYGVPADYEELELRGIDVKGKIVIARYGGSWRGIKPKVAAEHGASGCIIYSDPREDGYFAGDVYPRGGFRSERSVQRGSVADMPLFPGDPLTPGVGATPGAKRLALADAPTLTKIPVLPISYGDALPLLRAMAGPIAPAEWRGSLPIPYHLGPGPARVHLKLRFDWKQVPARDVIARLPGAELPDEWVVRGNHHDAWVNGASDPLSGLTAELAEARSLGALVKSGWRPKRTLVYAAWDGEEPGLIGSTEWVETHAAELRDRAIAYVNSDMNSRGVLEMGGSHTLAKLMNEVARDVTDPEKKVSVGDRLHAFRLVLGDAAARREAKSDPELRLGALGSGSDYTPFLQHLGIASLNLAYGGEGDYGQYHSIYDSFAHYVRFMDPKGEYGVALAQTAGRVVLRLANADYLPFEFGRFEATVGRYVKEVEELADKQRQETDDKNQAIAGKLYEKAQSPYQAWVTPKPQQTVPHFNFAPLENALEKVKKSAEAYQKAVDAFAAAGASLPAAAAAGVDAPLLRTERDLTGQGLPRRPWFVHQIYAPGFYTGYGVKTLPGVREGIEQRRYDEVEPQVEVTAKVLAAFAADVDRAAGALSAATAGAPKAAVATPGKEASATGQ
jgi:N-acetylated-alpha-linked acidic dipeptidase